MSVRWVVITQDNDQKGYRLGLRQRLAGNVADMQSRRVRSISEAKHEARRLFGGLLRWQEREDVGLGGQPYVMAVAEINVEPRD